MRAHSIFGSIVSVSLVWLSLLYTCMWWGLVGGGEEALVYEALVCASSVAVISSCVEGSDCITKLKLPLGNSTIHGQYVL